MYDISRWWYLILSIIRWIDTDGYIKPRYFVFVLHLKMSADEVSATGRCGKGDILVWEGEEKVSARLIRRVEKAGNEDERQKQCSWVWQGGTASYIKNQVYAVYRWQSSESSNQATRGSWDALAVRLLARAKITASSSCRTHRLYRLLWDLMAVKEVESHSYVRSGTPRPSIECAIPQDSANGSHIESYYLRIWK